MLRAINIPVTISAVGGRKLTTFNRVRYHSADRLSDEIIKADTEYSVYDGYPPNVLEMEDAFLPYQSKCLYDRKGIRINESCVRRRQRPATLVEAGPESIPVPTEFITIDQPVVFLSWL